MKKVTAIKHFGSAAKLAKALGISKSAVSHWEEEIPELRAYQLESLTNGGLVLRDGETPPASTKSS